MLGTALRALWLLALIPVAVAVASTYGRTAGIAALVGLGLVPAAVWFWLPRAAHGAFRKGKFKRAKLLYNALRLASLSRAARAAVRVSLAACALADEAWAETLAQLDRIDTGALGHSARAAWLNNRAYALARGKLDPGEALTCCDEALALRPDVAGFRHTRGVALLELGRVDEAIAELEGLWADIAGELGEDLPLLEAERCFDLGMAWKRKGERDYAADYFQRARRASPGSRWAERATELLVPHAVARAERTLAELIDA